MVLPESYGGVVYRIERVPPKCTIALVLYQIVSDSRGFFVDDYLGYDLEWKGGERGGDGGGVRRGEDSMS